MIEEEKQKTVAANAVLLLFTVLNSLNRHHQSLKPKQNDSRYAKNK